ncbi:hypothetical protein AMTRI_Chr05g58430 [Amborella trichopoda]
MVISNANNHRSATPLSSWETLVLRPRGPPLLQLFTKNRRIFDTFTFSATSACKSPSPLLENWSIEPKLGEIDGHLPNLQAPKSKRQSLNKFIQGLFRNRQTETLAFDYYQKAKNQPEFLPDQFTVNALAGFILRTKQWSLFEEFLVVDIKRFSVFPDDQICCRVLRSCIKARKFKITDLLLDVFGNDKKLGVQAYESAMRGYNKLHMFTSAISVYEKMKLAGISPDSNGFYQIMEAYHKLGQPENVMEVFRHFEGQSMDVSMSEKKIYAVLCDSLGKSGKVDEALGYFREMRAKGIKPDNSFYTSLICSSAKVKDVKLAETLFKEGKSKGLVKDPSIFLKLVLMYIEVGLVDKTLGIVDSMKELNIRVSDCVLCAIVNGYAKKRGVRSAIEAYDHLISNGCQPGQVTYASVINLYYRLGLYSKAETIFLEMQNQGFNECIIAYSNVVAIYGKTGRIKDAMKLVAQMKQVGCSPNVWVYNSLLDMHGKAMNLRQVEKTWKEMKRRRVQPDRVSYTSVILAYSKAGECEECMRFFKEFRMNGGRIDKIMGGIMVGVFSKSDRIDELVTLLQDMKLEGTLLDERLKRSAANALRDAGLQAQVGWLNESFGTKLVEKQSI